MSSKPSKQLGALLGRVPPATVNNTYGGAPVSYAPTEKAEAPSITSAIAPKPMPEGEVPIQVMVPRHVRLQIDRLHAETRKPLRAIVLEAFRAIGVQVTDEEITDKRGRRKS